MATAQGEIYPWHRHIPRTGSEEDLRALRALLAGYTEEEIRRRLKAPNAREDAAAPASTPVPSAAEGTLDTIIRLFHGCSYIEHSAFPADTLALLERLEWVARDPARPGFVYATVAIIPVAGELTVCDRGGSPDGSRCPLPPDLVYPAIFENTRRYVAFLPSTPCDALLELGTGTGIGTLVAGRHARHVWATDITARAVEFARLGCALAGLDHVTLVQGDLYAPVEGLTFDRICVHPPWVPATQSKFVFAEGGEDGETIIRGIIQGLPRFLRPGGRLYALLMASDRDGECFEQRVRRWLGAEEGQFDVTLAAFTITTPAEYLTQNLARQTIRDADIPAWLAMCKAHRIVGMLFAWLVIERHREERESATLRAPATAGCTGGDVEALLDWEVFIRDPGVEEQLMESRPVASEHCVLKTISRVHEGSVAVQTMSLDVSAPFRSTLACDFWLAEMVTRCDGERTWRDHYEWAKDGGRIPESITANQFAGLLVTLVRNGVVRRSR